MPEEEIPGNDPWGSQRGPSLVTKLTNYITMAINDVHERYHVPTYRPKGSHWDMTFTALGFPPSTVQKFWIVFCRINKSRSGEISILEFLNYFNLDRTSYVEKCFSYFDTTGGDDIDFLEFMVSVWNICTLDARTLSFFTFDIYDLDSDGELTVPELERMVRELYGESGEKSARGKECLRDLTRLAEERGGIVSLNSFISFTLNHAMLLFPVFQLQRTIQKKVMGLRYWEDVYAKSKQKTKTNKHFFDPRHVQILLRSYKTGGAAAILTHTGDPNEGLKDWFQREGLQLDDQQQHTNQSRKGKHQMKSIFRMLTNAVTKNNIFSKKRNKHKTPPKNTHNHQAQFTNPFEKRPANPDTAQNQQTVMVTNQSFTTVSVKGVDIDKLVPNKNKSSNQIKGITYPPISNENKDSKKVTKSLTDSKHFTNSLKKDKRRMTGPPIPSSTTITTATVTQQNDHDSGGKERKKKKKKKNKNKNKSRRPGSSSGTKTATVHPHSKKDSGVQEFSLPPIKMHVSHTM